MFPLGIKRDHLLLCSANECLIQNSRLRHNNREFCTVCSYSPLRCFEFRSTTCTALLAAVATAVCTVVAGLHKRHLSAMDVDATSPLISMDEGILDTVLSATSTSVEWSSHSSLPSE